MNAFDTIAAIVCFLLAVGVFTSVKVVCCAIHALAKRCNLDRPIFRTRGDNQ